MKKLLLILLLLMPFNAIAMTAPQMATVFHPETLHRMAVDVGDPHAFDNGYLLEVARAVTVPDDVMGFSVVTDYSKNLSSSMNSSQLTVPVTSMTTKDDHTLTMGDLGSKVFLVIEPGARKEEIVMCTTISGTTWGGCTRGLAFYGTSTASVAANRKTHSSGSTVIISNTHYIYDELIDKDATETIGGVKTFTSSPIVPSPTTGTQAANKSYVDNIVQQGGATSTESIVGIIQLGTQLEMASSTHDTNQPAALYTKYSTSTPPSSGLYVPVTENDGNLNQGWLDLTEDWTFGGNNTHSGTETFSATTTHATSTFNSIQIDGTTIDELISGTSTILHLHPVRIGSFASTTIANGTVQVVTHDLGVIPRYVEIESHLNISGVSTPFNIYSYGRWTEIDGTKTNDLWKSGNPGYDTGQQTTNIISIDNETSGNRDGVEAAISNVTSTTFTLTWNVDNNQSIFVTWKVE